MPYGEQKTTRRKTLLQEKLICFLFICAKKAGISPRPYLELFSLFCRIINSKVSSSHLWARNKQADKLNRDFLRLAY